ncbi:MAG: GPW/gp25 family protein [Bacteroidota bacterium]
MAENTFQKDLKITPRSFDRRVSDRTYVDLETTARGDLATVEGRENLVQALINRLLTRQGELNTLGHPRYGSRLHTLVGEPNNLRVRGLADAYIREAIAREKRIEKVNFIRFNAPGRGDKISTLEVTLGVKPVGDEPITIFIPINLEG